MKKFKQERELEKAFEAGGVISKQKQIKGLRARERMHIRSIRYNIRQGLYQMVLRDAGWLIQVQTLIERIESE